MSSADATPEVDPPELEERLVGGYTGRMLLLLALGSVANVAGRLVIPAILPTVIDGFSIRVSEAGAALTVMAAGMALFQYLGGRLSDQLSRKTVLVSALGLLIVGFSALAVAPTFGTFLIGVFVVGSAHGLYFPATFAQLSDLFVARRGQAFGITTASFSLGSALAPGLAIATLAVAPWRGAFLPVIALLCAVLVLMHRWNRGGYVVDAPDLDVRATVARLFASRTIRRSFVAVGLAGFVWQGGVNFVPTFLQVERGFSQPLASATFSGLFVVGMVANFTAGNLGDRVGYPVVAGGALAMAMAGLGLLVGAPGVPGVVGGALVFGGGISAFWPVMNAFVMDRFPAGNVGGDFGAFNALGLAVGSLGPTFVGVVAERATYATAFSGLIACLAVSVAILAWLVFRPDDG